MGKIKPHHPPGGVSPGERTDNMMYEVTVTIINSPTKVIGWGNLIKADSREQAREIALQYAKRNANKPYSRYKKCAFEVKEEDIVARPDW